MQHEAGFDARRAAAAEEFNHHESREDGERVVTNLAEGLTLLRDLLYSRTRHDVEQKIGRDSMMMPVSELKTEKQAKTEIEIYQIAVSTAFVQSLGYASMQEEWYLKWLTRLRLGEPRKDDKITARLDTYLSKSDEEQRLAFSNVLAKVLPESRRAPLVLFRLLPLAVKIATALAFDDRETASEARQRQVTALPPISDCRSCRSKLLPASDQCNDCGNPLWKYEWLTATD
jgi:hypothetical protein